MNWLPLVSESFIPKLLASLLRLALPIIRSFSLSLGSAINLDVLHLKSDRNELVAAGLGKLYPQALGESFALGFAYHSLVLPVSWIRHKSRRSPLEISFRPAQPCRTGSPEAEAPLIHLRSYRS